jgi:hypothetical protein
MEVSQKLKMDLSCDSVIPFLSLYPKECKSAYNRDIQMPMFIITLFPIAKTRKQPRCTSSDEWIKMMWNVYTMESII